MVQDSIGILIVYGRECVCLFADDRAASSSRGNNTFLFIAAALLVFLTFSVFGLAVEHNTRNTLGNYNRLRPILAHCALLFNTKIVSELLRRPKCRACYNCSIRASVSMENFCRAYTQPSTASEYTEQTDSIIINYRIHCFSSFSVRCSFSYWHLLHIHRACVLILTVCCLFAWHYLALCICFDRSIDRYIVAVLASV